MIFWHPVGGWRQSDGWYRVVAWCQSGGRRQVKQLPETIDADAENTLTNVAKQLNRLCYVDHERRAHRTEERVDESARRNETKKCVEARVDN